MTANPRLVDIHELARWLNTAEGTIRNQRHSHPLYKKAIKLGAANSRLLWRSEEVEAYLDGLTQETA